MSRVVTLASILMLSAVVASQAAHAQADALQGLVIEAKFDTATEYVLIPVTIGGHDFWCNSDTEFSALIALDQTKAVAAGLSVSPGVPTPRWQSSLARRHQHDDGDQRVTAETECVTSLKVTANPKGLPVSTARRTS